MQGPPRGSHLRSGRAAPATAALIAAAVFEGLAGQSQQPPRFRSGTNVVRIDATVIDNSGRPVTSLGADDFEVREDGVLQPLTSFQLLSNTGQPSDDRSLPIRSQHHAATEAARDDVRVFLIFWDEYHIGRFESTLKAKTALEQVVMTAFGPTDLVAIMDPLTPSSAIAFTRDRRALADQIHRLEGRSRVYLPPRSAVEEAQLEAVNWRVELVEQFRHQVTGTAIKAAAAHLATLREGRKTMIVVTEGFGLAPTLPGPLPGPYPREAMNRYIDDENSARDIVRAANDSNTAVHIIDPRGLRVAGGVAAMLETLASGSGGEVHGDNDISAAVVRIVGQASATYLLGYTKDTVHDGRFHQIKVRVKRGGYDVRARNGYWAPTVPDVERARTAAAAAVLPPPIASAFASLNPANSSRLVEIWTAIWPLPENRSLVSIAWTPIATPSPGPPGAEAATVSVSLTAGAEPGVEKVVDPSGTSFEIAGSTARLAIRVLDKTGEVIDRELRTVETAAVPQALGLAATVHRARNVAETRALSAGDPPIHAGREFSRSERVLVRIRAYGTQAQAAAITARLIDRRGTTLIALQITAPPGDWHRLDLPLASIAPGDFAVVIEARSGDDRAETIVPLRIKR